jgi:hypothetical protein
MEAVRGLRTIYPSKGARLVPLKERPAAITVNRAAKAAIERDSWVRVRGGLYKDDLAKVRLCGCAVRVVICRHHTARVAAVGVEYCQWGLGELGSSRTEHCFSEGLCA